MGNWNRPIYSNGLIQWFRADLGVVLSGTSVTTWIDQMGSGNNFANVPAAFPTLSTRGCNGRPGISFSGGAAGPYMRCPRVLADDWTYFTVWQSTAGGYGIGYFEGAELYSGAIVGVANEFGASIGTDGVVHVWEEQAGLGSFQVEGPSGYHDGTPHVLVSRRTKSTGVIELFIDGRFIGLNSGTTASLTDNAYTYIARGGESTSTALTGIIPEVVVYNRVMPDFEVFNTLRYLQLRYSSIVFRR